MNPCASPQRPLFYLASKNDITLFNRKRSQDRPCGRNDDEPAQFVATISACTQNKDSFAAPKTLPFNDFSHFAQCARLRDLTAGPRRGSASLRRPRVRALAKTRMNTRFPPANGGPKRAVTNILTRVLLS
jgi:hypothetical protein